MKVIWLSNKPIVDGHKSSGSWFYSLYNLFLDKKPEIELVCLYPSSKKTCVDLSNGRAYSFKSPTFAKPYSYSKKTESFFSEILATEKPDVIHIWGTEFAFSLCMVNAAKMNNCLDRVIVHIQGFCFAVADHMYNLLPNYVIKGSMLKDFLIGNIARQKKSFEKRGKNEITLLKTVNNVFGRTNWDKACCSLFNEHINYYYCGEMLRSQFYEKVWDYSKCEKRSIFISQASYSLKGLHIFLKAFSLVVSKFPDSKVYIAGKDITMQNKGTKRLLYLSMYGLYIKHLIKKYKLQQNIFFVGALDAENMSEYFKNCNVYVLPSLIENSSNSLGEALMVGTPTIASYVGGVPDFIQNNINGFLYPADDAFLLASLICQLFQSKEKCEMFSANGREKARKLYDMDTILDTVLDTYNIIVKQTNANGTE